MMVWKYTESEWTLPHILAACHHREKDGVPASLADSMCVDDDSGSWLRGMCKFMWPELQQYTAGIHIHSQTTRTKWKCHSESASHSHHSLTAQGKEASLGQPSKLGMPRPLHWTWTNSRGPMMRGTGFRILTSLILSCWKWNMARVTMLNVM